MEALYKDAEFIPLGSGIPRSTDRVHLTDVMKSIEDELGLGYKGDGFEDRFLTMEHGFWWEDVLEWAWAERSAVRIGEIELDGIVGSPDGVCPDPGFTDEDGVVMIEPSDELILEEYKYIWASAKNPPHKVWKYIVQTKAYCKMLEFNKVLMRICYCFGYWNGKGPRYREGYFTFTQQELDDNWNMIVNHAKEKGMI